jgi:formyltetrahydrofolate deformylase
MATMRVGTITVIGKDKTGVIARVTNFLFEHGANIEALEEQVTRGQFSMTLQASWPENRWVPKMIEAGLTDLGRSLGMEITVNFNPIRSRQRMAIFASLEPHAPQGLLESVDKGTLKADPVVMVSNHPTMKKLAKKHKVPFKQINWANRKQGEEETLALMEKYRVDFIVLARFMKILSPTFVWHYKNRIINIHPSLLPSFPGPQAYRQAYEHGVKIAGVTAHFVNMHLDEGPIIAQESFSIQPNMTLMDVVAKGQKMETKALIRAAKLFLSKRLDVHWGTVKEV